MVLFYYFQKYWNFDLECKRGKRKAAFRARKVTGWGLFLERSGNFSGPKSCFKVNFTSRLEKLPGLSRNGPPKKDGKACVINRDSHYFWKKSAKLTDLL